MIGMYLKTVNQGQCHYACDKIILLGVACVPKRIEAAGPWCDLAIVSEEGKSEGTEESNEDDRDLKQFLELL